MNQKRLLLVNTFGVFGYISCMLQWLWAGIIFVPLLLENDTVRNLFLPAENTTPPPASSLEPPSLIMMIVAIIVTVIVIGIAAVVLVRLPISIAKAGQKTVQATAQVILPVVTHHQKLPPKKKRLLTFRLIKIIKFSFCILPILLMNIVYFVDNEIEDGIVIFVAAIFGAGSLFWFAFEYLSAQWLKIPQEKIL